MNSQLKYPTTYELKEILGKITNRNFLNEFAQRRGIFIMHTNQDGLATELSKLFYDNNDLENIRKEAYRENHSHTLSGFILKSDNKKFNAKNLYENVRTQAKFDIGIKLNEVTKVNDDETFHFKSSFEYTKPKAGRIEFLQNETNSFDFYFTELNPGTWQIEVDSNKSTDTKEIKNLFIKNLSVGQCTVELISQDYLTSKSAIDFFDKLAKDGLDKKEWSLLDVKHLTVKRGNDKVEDEDYVEEEEDSDSPKAHEEELAGIRQAILEGKNLREDSFVKDCEAKGYRFSAMTYEFESLKTPQIVSIKAEFKGRPKVFEVGIPEVLEKAGLGSDKYISHLPAKDSRILRSAFWNNAKVIYDTMKTK